METLFKLPDPSERPAPALLHVPALKQPGSDFQPAPIVPDGPAVRADLPPLPRFRTALVPNAFRRTFKPLPPESIHHWASKSVWLSKEITATPGFYNPTKTPWTRRLQELVRDPYTIAFDHRTKTWLVVPVRRIWIKKSSQSGFSEACLNIIRWHAKHAPRSCIYAIDSIKQAQNVSERLSDTFKRLGIQSKTGTDRDIGTYLMRLRNMRVYFTGSFSAAEFANKFASMCFGDEVEEHGNLVGDTDTLTNLESRFKTDDDGFIVGLSKPKKSSGPIAKRFRRGNCEEQFIRCPHPECRKLQPITFFGAESERPEVHKETPFDTDQEPVTITDEQTGKSFKTWIHLPAGQTKPLIVARIRFDHCRTEGGQWDDIILKSDTFAECGHCHRRIDEKLHKARLAEEAIWLPTAVGELGVISQHCHDLLSSDANSAWGELATKFLSVRNDRKGLQGFFNHQLGVDTTDEATDCTDNDIRQNMGLDYRRGQVPWKDAKLVLGSDIGQSHARWVVCAIRPEDGALAVIDWGNYDSPDAVAELVMHGAWPIYIPKDDTGKLLQPLQIDFGFMDAKFRKQAALTACLATGGIMFPALGAGQNTQRRPFTWNKYERTSALPQWFGYLTFNTHEAKSSLYIDRYKKRSPGIFFPRDVYAKESSERFCEEITKESLIHDTETDDVKWDDKHPNHFGAALVGCDRCYAWLSRAKRPGEAAKSLRTADEIADAIKARHAVTV